MRECKPTQRLTLYNCLSPEFLRGFRLTALLAPLGARQPLVVFLGRITDLGILSLTKSLENRGNLCRINATKIGGDFGVGAFLGTIGSVKKPLNRFLALPRNVLRAAVLDCLLRLHARNNAIISRAEKERPTRPLFLLAFRNVGRKKIAVLKHLNQPFIGSLRKTLIESLYKCLTNHLLLLLRREIAKMVLDQFDNLHPLSLNLERRNRRNALDIDLIHDLSISIE
jgi:hypothetical protein